MGQLANKMMLPISHLLILLVVFCSLSPLIILSIETDSPSQPLVVEHNNEKPDHLKHHSDDSSQDACCIGEDLIFVTFSDLIKLFISSSLLLLSIYSLHKYFLSNPYFKQTPYKRPLFPPLRILLCTFTI